MYSAWKGRSKNKKFTGSMAFYVENLMKSTVSHWKKMQKPSKVAKYKYKNQLNFYLLSVKK